MCLHLDAVMCWVHANREMDFFDVKSTVGHLQSRGMRHGSRMSPKHTLCGHGAHAVCLGRFWKGAHALRPTSSVRFEQKSLCSFFSTTTLVLGRLNALDVNFTSPRHSPPCSSLSGGLDARTAPRGLLHLVMGEPIAPWPPACTCKKLARHPTVHAPAARSEIAAFALVAEAKDEAATAFYRHHGLIALADSSLTLFLPLATARHSWDSSPLAI